MLLMGKSTISMAMFNSYVKSSEGNFMCSYLLLRWRYDLYLYTAIYIYTAMASEDRST